MQEVKEAVQKAVKDVFELEADVVLTRPNEKFGDFATNVALQLAQKLGKNPREVADAIIGGIKSDVIEKTDVAGPGFINITLTDAALAQSVAHATELPKINDGKQILVEFGDPNPFKEMHLGHLYTTVIGDSIARLLESTGADVKRLSYHGDVGMHIAKAIYGMQAFIKQGKDVSSLPQSEKSEFLFGFAYAYGAQHFDEDPAAKTAIERINDHIYERDDEEVNKLYDKGWVESFKIFDKIFEELGVHFEKRYLESESTPIGIKYVRDNTGKVFEESDGAVVYKGEKVGLHTRVFINSRGRPTYEAKDLGLTELKNKDYPEATRSIIITAHEQSEYFKVMLAALREIDPGIADKTTHLAHGFLSLTTGKMSSRTGKVYRAADLLEAVLETITNEYPGHNPANGTYLAAVKYTLLKNRLGGDIVFDIEESVSLEGNSGPYLQYAHARARSVLAKAETPAGIIQGLEPGERSLARKISEYPEVVELATNELMPHHIATYLYELAQTFNRFYENNRVIGDPRESLRLGLVKSYAATLKSGLNLLGIVAPEKM